MGRRPVAGCFEIWSVCGCAESCPLSWLSATCNTSRRLDWLRLVRAVSLSPNVELRQAAARWELANSLKSQRVHDELADVGERDRGGRVNLFFQCFRVIRSP